MIQVFIISSLLCTMCSSQNNTNGLKLQEDAVLAIDTISAQNEHPVDNIEIIKETIAPFVQHPTSIINDDVHRIGFYKDYIVYEKLIRKGEELDSIELYLNYKKTDNYIIRKSIYSDKTIHVSFSETTPLMIINYLDFRPEYYDSAIDDYFWIYNLDSLANGILHKDSIYCKYCSDGYVINDKLFFARSNERDDFYDGFALSDIYVAPLDHIEDSVAIARKFRIRAISSDGKYILAQNKNTIRNWSCAIINVEQKKYQVLLGRDYHARQVIYSDEERKFGFIFGEKIVYVDMPQTFPFDALEKRNIFWPRPKGDWYKKFEKQPLE